LCIGVFLLPLPSCQMRKGSLPQHVSPFLLDFTVLRPLRSRNSLVPSASPFLPSFSVSFFPWADSFLLTPKAFCPPPSFDSEAKWQLRAYRFLCPTLFFRGTRILPHLLSLHSMRICPPLTLFLSFFTAVFPHLEVRSVLLCSRPFPCPSSIIGSGCLRRDGGILRRNEVSERIFFLLYVMMFVTNRPLLGFSCFYIRRGPS